MGGMSPNRDAAKIIWPSVAAIFPRNPIILLIDVYSLLRRDVVDELTGVDSSAATAAAVIAAAAGDNADDDNEDGGGGGGGYLFWFCSGLIDVNSTVDSIRVRKRQDAYRKYENHVGCDNHIDSSVKFFLHHV